MRTDTHYYFPSGRARIAAARKAGFAVCETRVCAISPEGAGADVDEPAALILPADAPAAWALACVIIDSRIPSDMDNLAHRKGLTNAERVDVVRFARIVHDGMTASVHPTYNNVPAGPSRADSGAACSQLADPAGAPSVSVDMQQRDADQETPAHLLHNRATPEHVALARAVRRSGGW